MKKWNFKAKGNPKEIIKKLDSELLSDNGFVFKVVNNKDGAIIFKIRKRLGPSYLIGQQNRIVVNGKIFKADTENETDVNISFFQHFLIIYGIFEVSLFFIFGLIVIISGLNIGFFNYILGGALFAIGIILCIDSQKKFEKNVNQYKLLISEILES